MNHKTAIVLVHYEDYAEKHYAECYQSLLRQNVAPDSFTIFIVNNGAETDYLKSTAGPMDIRFIDHQENVGWAGGNNAAIKIALEENYEYVVMLNMDTTLDDNWLTCLLEEAIRRPDTHILQSKILLYNSRKINSAGNRTHFLGYGYCHGYGQEEAAVLQEIDFASGASMLVKNDVFRKIGYFRENYFLYYDDMEFCWRARLAGYHIGLADKSICFHKYDSTNKLRQLFYLERNRLLTVLTLEKPGTLVLIAGPLVLAQIISGFYFVLHGYGKEILRLFSFFIQPQAWKYIFKTRREICKLRVKKDGELVKNFAGKIVFAEIKSPVLNWFFNPILWVYWNVVKHTIFW